VSTGSSESSSSHGPWLADDFPRGFEAEILWDLPGIPPIFETSKDGISVSVKIGNRSWWARFPFLVPEYPLPTGIIACPSPQALLVLSRGAAYYVDVCSPTLQKLDLFPVHGFLSARDDECILLAETTRICCIRKAGISWYSHDLVFDDLELLGVSDGIVHIQGFDPTDDSGTVSGLKMTDRSLGVVRRCVDLESGAMF